MEPGANGGLPEEQNGNRSDSEGSGSLAGRLVGVGTGGARRVVGATGIDQAMETAIEEAIVRAVQSEAVERSMTRIINGPLIENAVRDAMKSEAVEQALNDLVDSELVDRLWARILESDETQRLIQRIAEAPEVRAAIASQGLGLVDDLGRGIARVTRVIDFVLERIARRILFRKKRTTPTDRVGVATRLLALIIDGIIVNIIMVTSTALLGLVANVIGVNLGDLSSAAYAVGGVFWLALGSLYLFIFWSSSGQTPGMRFMDIRIEHHGQRAIGPRRAFRRLVGFWLSAIPFFLGFIGVLTRLERRGFHDRLGDTVVYYINPGAPNQPHLAAVIDPMKEEPPIQLEAEPALAAEKPVDSP